jgi:hypothetical protein
VRDAFGEVADALAGRTLELALLKFQEGVDVGDDGRLFWRGQTHGA